MHTFEEKQFAESFKASLSFVIVLDESNVTLSIPISSAQ